MARVAILVGAGFEDFEFAEPCDQLVRAGHRVVVIGAEAGATVEGKHRKVRATLERAASSVRPDDFDALVIPGGRSPAMLRSDPAVVSFVRDFVRTGKLVAAICHGPGLLAEAEAVHGRTVTSWPAVRAELEVAGAQWVDREVVLDGNLVTSRKPADLDAFCEVILKQLGPARAQPHPHRGK
jgi:deglycase